MFQICSAVWIVSSDLLFLIRENKNDFGGCRCDAKKNDCNSERCRVVHTHLAKCGFLHGGVGRGCGVGRGLGVTLGAGVADGVGVGVSVAVGLAVGVGVGLGVGMSSQVSLKYPLLS